VKTLLGTVVKRDKSGNEQRFTQYICPCCFKKYETQRKRGVAEVTGLTERQNRHCGAEKCKKQWRAFARAWNNKYGKYENWPPLPNTGANKKEYVRKCQSLNCESEFLITRWPHGNGKPIQRNDERLYCNIKCASSGYYSNVLRRPQRAIEERKKRKVLKTTSIDKLSNSYIKTQLQRQFKDEGIFIPFSEISQEMVEDKRMLLKLKRLYAKVTGKGIGSLNENLFTINLKK
tara:strand:- start:2450 stop:3145 length:696 start_codon:yes stop_codon:yes gene_type:complete